MTTSTAWNLKPTGRGWMLRTPASSSAASRLAIAEPAADPRGHLLEHALARRVLEQPHERLDLRREADEPGIDSSVDR